MLDRNSKPGAFWWDCRRTPSGPDPTEVETSDSTTAYERLALNAVTSIDQNNIDSLSAID